MSKQSPGEEGKVLEQQRSRTSSPPLYKVLMHNDDYTTMEFVVEALEGVFRKAPPEATRIMLNIHYQGVGLCGVYPHEIAETKVDKVHTLAKEAGFPLRCSLESI